jgi:hypothetical protein
MNDHTFQNFGPLGDRSLPNDSRHFVSIRGEESITLSVPI